MGKYVFGVDVGGTTVKLGLFDVQGTVKDKWEIPTVTTDNGVNIIPDIAEPGEKACLNRQNNKVIISIPSAECFCRPS